MIKKEETISIVPDVSLMPKIGKGAGYSLTEAIGELVDNSIDARDIEARLAVQIMLNRNGSNSFIKVKDNAEGMSREEIINAMRLAKSDKRKQLGEFGLGLKSACMSLGERFTVETSRRNKPVYVVALNEWDWMANQKWELKLIEKDKPHEDWNGTVIEINNLRLELRAESIKEIIDELLNRFQLFINTHSLSLEIEDVNYDTSGKKSSRKYKCEPKPVEYIQEESFRFMVKHGLVEGKIGILKEPLEKKFGFNTFRYNRLIEARSKIGMRLTIGEFSARYLHGYIHMSHVPVTHNKREWIKTSPEYREVAQRMREVTKPWLIKAQAYDKFLTEEKHIKKLAPKEIHRIFRIAARICEEMIGRDEMLLKAFKIKEDKYSDLDGLVDVQEKRIKKRGSKRKARVSGTGKVPKKEDFDKEQKEGFVMKIRGREYRFHIRQWAQGNNYPIKSWVKEEATGTIVVTINITHPIYINMKQSGLEYWLMLIAMEVMSEIIIESRTIEVRDKYLSKFLAR